MTRHATAVNHLDVMIQVSPFLFTVSGISTIAGFLVYTYFFQTPKIKDNSSLHSNISSPSSISSEMSDLSSVIATHVVPVVNTNSDLTKNLLDMPAPVSLSFCKSNLDNNLIDLTISTNYEYHFLWNESINIELHKFFFDFFL